jgi:hypothetical protein
MAPAIALTDANSAAMTLSRGWGTESDADQNPKAAAASAQTMLMTSALFIANEIARDIG